MEWWPRSCCAVARSAHFAVGQPVELTVRDCAVVVTPIGEVRRTLTQKLAVFDPAHHAGEVMATNRVGRETM